MTQLNIKPYVYVIIIDFNISITIIYSKNTLRLSNRAIHGSGSQ